MGRIEELAAHYERHISVPWQRTIAGAQRVIIVVYQKDDERRLRARIGEFHQRTEAAGHGWSEFDCTRLFAEWMAKQEYREEYFESPEDLSMKLDGRFIEAVAEPLRRALSSSGPTGVVGMTGVASLYGFAHISQLVRAVQEDVQGRLVVFFPGTKDENNYRLLDARDGWNYLATCITLHGVGSAA